MISPRKRNNASYIYGRFDGPMILSLRSRSDLHGCCGQDGDDIHTTNFTDMIA